jgi:hypothetical protein
MDIGNLPTNRVLSADGAFVYRPAEGAGSLSDQPAGAFGWAVNEGADGAKTHHAPVPVAPGKEHAADHQQ